MSAVRQMLFTAVLLFGLLLPDGAYAVDEGTEIKALQVEGNVADSLRPESARKRSVVLDRIF